MPEGPSLVILREEAAHFKGKKIAVAEGNTKTVDLGRLAGKRITSLRSWGKHFIIEMPGDVLRIHFMMFGSYRINERKPDKVPRMSLQFTDGEELNFYACSVKPIDADLDAQYDWDADIMSPTWDPAKARKKLRANPTMLVCDALLDQTMFAGVGNIIKNEVLFRIRLHPLSTIGALSAPEAAATGGTGAPIQLRLPGMEKGIRAQKTLAGTQEDDLPALRHQIHQSSPRHQQSPFILL